MSARLCIGATFATALLIAYLTLTPGTGSTAPGPDKFYHFIAFAALSFWLPLRFPTRLITVVIAATAFGGAIEVIQPFVNRSAEWGDLLADAAGALFGGTLGMFIAKRRL